MALKQTDAAKRTRDSRCALITRPFRLLVSSIQRKPAYGEETLAHPPSRVPDSSGGRVRCTKVISPGYPELGSGGGEQLPQGPCKIRNQSQFLGDCARNPILRERKF